MASVRTNLSGLAAVTALAVVVAALLKRRMRIGWLLLHIAVALGEQWKEGRDRARLAGLVDLHRPHGSSPDSTGKPA